MFCDRMDVEKPPKGSLLSVFQHCETFFRNFFLQELAKYMIELLELITKKAEVYKKLSA